MHYSPTTSAPKDELVRIRHFGLDEARSATGVAVAIDVLRAFTTAAYALQAGATSIVLTDDVEYAFAIKARLPG